VGSGACVGPPIISIRTDCCWYRLGKPAAGYAPWHKPVLKATALATKVMGMLEEETRTARLSFKDVVHRLAEQRYAELKLKAQQGVRVPHSTLTDQPSERERAGAQRLCTPLKSSGHGNPFLKVVTSTETVPILHVLYNLGPVLSLALVLVLGARTKDSYGSKSI